MQYQLSENNENSFNILIYVVLYSQYSIFQAVPYTADFYQRLPTQQYFSTKTSYVKIIVLMSMWIIIAMILCQDWVFLCSRFHQILHKSSITSDLYWLWWKMVDKPAYLFLNKKTFFKLNGTVWVQVSKIMEIFSRLQEHFCHIKRRTNS